LSSSRSLVVDWLTDSLIDLIHADPTNFCMQKKKKKKKRTTNNKSSLTTSIHLSPQHSEFAPVWVEQPNHDYQLFYCTYNDFFAAELEKSQGSSPLLKLYDGASTSSQAQMPVEFDKVFRANTSGDTDVSDMTSLTYLEEPNMLKCLETRYHQDKIYTNIASVLVAINPYRQLGIYTTHDMAKYRGQRRLDLQEPHVFRLAEKAYQQLVTYGVNQSMICCGESGSGKTESTKALMRYLANVTQLTEAVSGDATASGNHASTSQLSLPGASLVEQQVLQANPILEAFGNAKTVMNNNSSRFAKFIKLFFWKDPEIAGDETRIMGAHTETYLLERSRVVNTGPRERNFHIFYQVCAAASQGIGGLDGELPDLPSPLQFRYLQRGDVKINGVDDAKDMLQLQNCMDVISMEPDEQFAIFRAIAAILFIGNVEFSSASSDSKELHDDAAISEAVSKNVTAAAQLLALEPNALRSRLIMRRVKVGSEVFEKPLDIQSAMTNRDSIAKCLYNGLFDWVVTRINNALYQGDEDELNWIGILDVFGFECFQNNSFEQFCINFANERLQDFFNNDILKTEQDEYSREGILWTHIDLPDNTGTISLVQSKPSGIVCLLDSACLMPKGDAETFHSNLFAVHRKHPKLSNVNSTTRNKASRARANVGGGARGAKVHSSPSKHRRRRSVVDIAASSIRFLGFQVEHYAGPVVYNCSQFLTKNADSLHPDTLELFMTSGDTLLPDMFETDAAIARKKRSNRFQSVGSKFCRQLGRLMDVLDSTQPYFIRCASPNSTQSSNKYVSSYVRPQLRCGGLVEALRMLKLGYPSRVPFEQVYERYAPLINVGSPWVNRRNFCEAVLIAFGLGPSEYQLGLTKIFFRPGKQEFLNSVLRRSKDPVTPEIANKIISIVKKRRLQRIVGTVRAHVRFTLRMRGIRAAIMFRQAVMRATVYCQTLKKLLYRTRRRINAKLYAAEHIQSFWRHVNRRKHLRKALQTRIREKRRARFQQPQVDETTQQELASVRAEYRSAKKREAAEQEKMDVIRREAQEKEEQLASELKERQEEMVRLQEQLVSMKDMETESKQQAELVEQLKKRTQQLREENERAINQSKLVMEEKEKELIEKQAEMSRLKDEAEARRLEAEAKAAEVLKQAEAERLQREADVQKLKEEADALRHEQEGKAAEAAQLLADQERLNLEKEAELAKLQQQAARQSEMTDDFKRRLEEKQTEQAEAQAHLDRMRLKLEEETRLAQIEMHRVEAENAAKEARLKEAEEARARLLEEMESRQKRFENDRERERRRLEEEFKRLEVAAQQTREHFEAEARKQREALDERERENREKERALFSMQQEQERVRIENERALEEARKELSEKEKETQSELADLRQSLEEAERVQLKQQAESQKQLEAKLREADSKSKSEMEQMSGSYIQRINQLELQLVAREEELEIINDELEGMQSQNDKKIRSVIGEYEAKLREKDDLLEQLRDELSTVRQATEEVSAISERLLKEELEESSRREAEMKKEVEKLKLQLAQAQGKQKPGVSRFGFNRGRVGAKKATPKTGPKASNLSRLPSLSSIPGAANPTSALKKSVSTSSIGSSRSRRSAKADPDSKLSRQRSTGSIGGRSRGRGRGRGRGLDRGRGRKTAASGGIPRSTSKSRTPKSRMAASRAVAPSGSRSAAAPSRRRAATVAGRPPAMHHGAHDGETVSELFTEWMKLNKSELSVKVDKTVTRDCYKFGYRRVTLKVVDGELMVKRTGGFDRLDDFITKNSMWNDDSI
jgi:myosin heavy subunit